MSDNQFEDNHLEESRTRRWVPLIVGLAVIALVAGVIAGLLLNRDRATANPAGTTSAPSQTTAGTVSTPPSSAPTATMPTAATTKPSVTSTSTKPTATVPSTKPSSKPPTSKPPTSKPPKSEEQYFYGTGKAVFPYLTVEVKPEPSGYQPPDSLKYVYGWYVTTCVTSLPDQYKAAGKLPVSTSPFSAVKGTASKTYSLKRLDTGGHQPAYPVSASLAPGQCVTGFVSFDYSQYVDVPSDFVNLVYQNSLGDKATWNIH